MDQSLEIMMRKKLRLMNANEFSLGNFHIICIQRVNIDNDNQMSVMMIR